MGQLWVLLRCGQGSAGARAEGGQLSRRRGQSSLEQDWNPRLPSSPGLHGPAGKRDSALRTSGQRQHTSEDQCKVRGDPTSQYEDMPVRPHP